jgi:acetoin utilization deacetylase AcuC-like enzyme
MHATGIVSDLCFLDHVTPEGHPEHHRRLEAIAARLGREAALTGRLRSIAPRRAARKDLASVHQEAYLSRLAATAGVDLTALTADTFASRGSFAAASLAAGGVMAAIDAVMAGEVENAFALVRPPGHHAEISRAMGYCLLNNVALGAIHARSRHGLKRILIVDWDVHHGNGTQHVFESDPGVLFCSTHQWPLFPWTGLFTETGLGAGEGYTVNLPMPRGYGNGEYAAIYRHLLVPIAAAYGPELILVSAGFDTHRDDPIGAMKMTEAGFAVLTRILMDLAEHCCAGRLVLVLEGGYHLEALAKSVATVVAEMAGLTVADPDRMAEAAEARKCDYIFSRCRPVHGRRWPAPN